MQRTNREGIMQLIKQFCNEYDIDDSDIVLFEREEWEQRVDRQGYPDWMKTRGDYVLCCEGELGDVLSDPGSYTRPLDNTESTLYRYDGVRHRLDRIGYCMDQIDSVHCSIHWKEGF